MDVVCLEERAFYALFDKVVEHIEKKFDQQPHKWIDGEEAMSLLNISSKTTLQKLRDTGKIRFSQPQPRIILYDRNSIDEYLENHAQDTF
jgi:hypothetical protein